MTRCLLCGDEPVDGWMIEGVCLPDARRLIRLAVKEKRRADAREFQDTMTPGSIPADSEFEKPLDDAKDSGVETS